MPKGPAPGPPTPQHTTLPCPAQVSAASSHRRARRLRVGRGTLDPQFLTWGSPLTPESAQRQTPQKRTHRAPHATQTSLRPRLPGTAPAPPL